MHALLEHLGAPRQLADLLPPEELVPYVLRDLPGEVGRALRRQWYPALFAALGEGATIGAGVTFEGPRAIHVGPGVRTLAWHLHSRRFLLGDWP